MVTAMIAQLDLLSSNPEVLEMANEVLAPLNGALTHGLSNSFVETACWADDIKYYQLLASNEWHYIDKPYNYDGLLDATGPESNNILWAMQQSMATLGSQNVDTSPLETSLQLRYLIHWLGDIHQPLHATQRFTISQPYGDAGGNFFKTYSTENPSVTNLHKLWDWGLGTIGNDCPRPLTEDCWNEITSYGKNIIKEWPRSRLEEYLNEPSTENWATDSFHNAVQKVYKDMTEGKPPSLEYMIRGKPIISRQLALGGYRLADLLRSIWANLNK